MAKKTTNPELELLTTGVEPILRDNPVVEINGVEYPMRSLGISDTFRLLKIISTGVAKAGLPANVNEKNIVMLLVSAVPYTEEPIMELLASIIGVTYKELCDPKLFPMGSEIEIIEKLAEHQDLKAFFTRLGKIAQIQGTLQDHLPQQIPQDGNQEKEG
jgi:hypothetical protein